MTPITTFPTAWVITLKNSTENGVLPCQGGTQAQRWQLEEEHLKAAGVPYKPFCGIDGKVSGLTTEYTFDSIYPGEGRRLGIPVVSIYLSHYMLWKTLEYQDGDYFLILEDDCRFDADWRTRFDAAWAILPDDWDFLYVGSCDQDRAASGMVGENTNLYRQHAMCTHCYMVRKKAIPVLLDKMMRVCSPVDIAVIHQAFNHLNVYTISPSLAAQWSLPK